MPHSLLILQLGVILVATQLVGRSFRWIGQPQVIGEMVAGILLGPSLLGALLPGVAAFLFPPDNMPLLGSISDLGLVLFLFIIGLEHDPASLRGRGAVALTISWASIAVPFALGALLAVALYPRGSGAGVSVTQFALFVGTTMSITAFPVLARIVAERGMLGTPLGSLAIVCAAVNDVVGWLMIAALLLLVRRGEVTTSWLAVPGVVVFAAVMLTVARRALRPFATVFEERGELTQRMFAIVLAIAFASAWLTARLGVHPLFGAFLAGVAMPRSPGFVQSLTRRIEDVTVVALLPVFFVVSGLRTRVGLLDEPVLWLYFVAVLGAAVAGKIGGATLAGRVTGLAWRDGLAVGVLVNTRGLVELVLLNIGLDAGVISPALFTMMVLMAIVTTFMATPLLDWIGR